MSYIYIYNLYTLNYNQRFQKTFLQTVPENPVLKDLLFWRWNLASALMVLKLVLHMRQVWNFHDSGVRGPNVAIFVVAMTRLFRVKINEMYHITKYDLHSYHKSFSSMLFCLASFPFQYCFNLPHFSNIYKPFFHLYIHKKKHVVFYGSAHQDKLMVLDLWNMANICWRPWVSETRPTCGPWWDFFPKPFTAAAFPQQKS